VIVTPFGNMAFGDESGLQNWLDGHDQRHYLERQAIARTGIPLPARTLQGPLNPEWFGAHMMQHGTLMQFMQPDQTVGSQVLEMQWDTEEKFYRWHQIHNDLHRRLDQALGIPA
jgi:hypothetical protein